MKIYIPLERIIDASENPLPIKLETISKFNLSIEPTFSVISVKYAEVFFFFPFSHLVIILILFNFILEQKEIKKEKVDFLFFFLSFSFSFCFK